MCGGREKPGSDTIFQRRNWFSLCRRPSCFCRPFFAGFIWIIIFDLFCVLFHYFSETWLTICDWTTRFPAFNSRRQSKAYRSIPDTVYFVLLKREEQDCSSLPAIFLLIFLNLVFRAWQLRKNERYCGKNYKYNVCIMYALGSALEKSAVWITSRCNVE